MTFYTVALGLLWLFALSVFQTRSHQVLGAGLEEYRRVVSATFWIFGVVAILRCFSNWSRPAAISRSPFPSESAGLAHQPVWDLASAPDAPTREGECRTPLLVIGDRGAVSNLIAELTYNDDHNYQVVGVGIHDHLALGEYLGS